MDDVAKEEKVRLTPKVYEDMNKEFEEDGIPFEFAIPTQEALDKWQNMPPAHYATPPQIDMVAEMWKKHNAQTKS